MKEESGDIVLLPQPIETEAEAILKNYGFKVIVALDSDPATVAPLMDNAWAIILRTGIYISRELIESSARLSTISRTGGGVDNIDLDAATKNGVIVTSSLGVNTNSVVEHCLALIMALYKELFLMDHEVRNNNFAIRFENLPRDLNGKTLGVVGFGRIGLKVAQSCRQLFGMNILAYDIYMEEKVGDQYASWVKFVSLPQIFSDSDVISLHIPLTDATRGLVDRNLLNKMKANAIIINTSRGEIVCENDLAEILNDGRIAGAGLDVFNKEPLPADSPLIRLKNVILTPHTAALTKECVIRMATSAAERVVDLNAGFIPANIANPEVLNHKRWLNLRDKNFD
jgi:D-3-phosphoglycerate dehydrogenase